MYRTQLVLSLIKPHTIPYTIFDFAICIESQSPYDAVASRFANANP